MANRKRAEARRKAAAKASREGAGSKLWVWITIGVVAVVAIVGVVIATSGDEEAAAPDGSSVSSENPLADLPDSQPVTITGEPLPEFASTEGDPAVGTAAPVVEGKDFQGDAIAIDAATDGPTMVVFLAHWCPHCNAEVPVLLDWKNSGQIPTGLNVVGVATAAASTQPNYPPAQWFSQKGWSWPVLVDQSTGEGTAGEVAVSYGATGWPYIVMIDADGNVTARASGEKTVAELQALADTAMG